MPETPSAEKTIEGRLDFIETALEELCDGLLPIVPSFARRDKPTWTAFARRHAARVQEEMNRLLVEQREARRLRAEAEAAELEARRAAAGF